MTTNVSTKPLGTLTAELWDFLELAEDLGLSGLDRVTLHRGRDDAGWKCQAVADSGDDAQDMRTVAEYAAYAGGVVKVSKPYPCAAQASGMQVHARTLIVVADVPIEVIAYLDVDAYAAAMESDRRELVAR